MGAFESGGPAATYYSDGERRNRDGRSGGGLVVECDLRGCSFPLMDGMAPRPLLLLPHRLPSRPPRELGRGAHSRTSTITERRPRFCFSLSRPRPKEIPPLNEIRKKEGRKEE